MHSPCRIYDAIRSDIVNQDFVGHWKRPGFGSFTRRFHHGPKAELNRFGNQIVTRID